MSTLKIGEYEVLYPDWAKEKVAAHKWRIQRANRSQQLDGKRIVYAKSGRGKGAVFLHRLLYPHIKLIEHIDGDGLNNMEWNIRSVRSRKNMDDEMRNIQWNGEKKMFYVRMVFGKKRKARGFTVGRYGSKEAARRAALACREKWKQKIMENKKE